MSARRWRGCREARARSGGKWKAESARVEERAMAVSDEATACVLRQQAREGIVRITQRQAPRQLSQRPSAPQSLSAAGPHRIPVMKFAAVFIVQTMQAAPRCNASANGNWCGTRATTGPPLPRGIQGTRRGLPRCLLE